MGSGDGAGDAAAPPGPPCRGAKLLPAEPLHRRAPKRDARGRAYGDFMLLFPGLRSQRRHVIEQTLGELERVLVQLAHLVVFAEFNLKLNLLWVTVVPGRDIALRVAAAIQSRVPQAKLVAANLDYA
jgi:hypothetical protein